jgi:hypothetical protein
MVRCFGLLSTAAFASACNINSISETACTSGSNAAHSGSCQTAGGSFCCHDHTYTTPNFPDPGYAFATYTYDSDVVLQRVEVEQHSNGVNCVRAELDGADAGIACVDPIGNAQ